MQILEHFWGPRSAGKEELTKGRRAVRASDCNVGDAPKLVKNIVKFALTHVHREVADVNASHGLADRGRSRE